MAREIQWNTRPNGLWARARIVLAAVVLVPLLIFAIFVVLLITLLLTLLSVVRMMVGHRPPAPDAFTQPGTDAEGRENVRVRRPD